MTYTYEQLSKMTVVELRKIADGIEHEVLKGHSTMHKEKLLPLLCKALNIEVHVHHKSVGIDRTAIKAQIKSLKKQRKDAVAAKDYNKLREIRQNIHNLKVRLRSLIE